MPLYILLLLLPGNRIQISFLRSSLMFHRKSIPAPQPAQIKTAKAINANIIPFFSVFSYDSFSPASSLHILSGLLPYYCIIKKLPVQSSIFWESVLKTCNILLAAFCCLFLLLSFRKNLFHAKANCSIMKAFLLNHISAYPYTTNTRIYRIALAKRIWLALCSQVTRTF